MVAAGVAAGMLNAVVGAGTLVTFPLLLALGVPPLTANVSNTLGLVPGSLSAAWRYRGLVAPHRHLVTVLVGAGCLGALVGATALLVLPAAAFTAAVPVLLLAAAALVAVQPLLSRWLARRGGRAGTVLEPGARVGLWLPVGVGLSGVYGGYFGAAQGVLLLGLLGVALGDLQTANGVKNLVAGGVNLVAGALFALAAPVNWAIAGLLAVGSVAGGALGAHVGQKLPDKALRAVVVVIGVVAAVRALVG